MNRRYVITFLILFIFYITDSVIFLVAENETEEYLESYTFLDKYTGPIFVGSLTSGISMIIASYIKSKYFPKLKIIDNPFLDLFSIIVGAVIVIGISRGIHYIRN
tara:strand:+ start:534 stop:848 length:315 start_codon:yes stop_codon:yes gene_type:complete